MVSPPRWMVSLVFCFELKSKEFTLIGLNTATCKLLCFYGVWEGEFLRDLELCRLILSLLSVLYISVIFLRRA